MLEIIFVILSIIATTLSAIFWIPYNGFIYILYYALLFIGYYIIAFLIFAIFFGLLGRTISLKKEYKKVNRFYRFLMEAVMGFVIRAMHVKIHVTGKELIPNEPFLLVQNHRHGLDPIMTVHCFRKHKIAFITKKENLKAPFAGRYMHRSCYLALDREDPVQALGIIKEACRLIKEENLSIGVFPEGTRNKTTEPLLEFKDGCLKIALRAKCPIVVTVLKNSRAIGKRPHLHPLHVDLKVIKIIPYEEYKGMKTVEIGNMIKELMLEELKK